MSPIRQESSVNETFPDHAFSTTAAYGRLRKRRLALALATAGVFAASAGAFASNRPGTADEQRTDDPAALPEPQADEAAMVDPFADDAPTASVSSESAADPEGTIEYDPAADTVEIHVSGASIVDVLRMLAAQSQKNIIASKEVGGTVTCNLYDVTVQEALDAILKGNGLAVREEGSFLYVYTQEQLTQMEEANRRPETRVFRLFHTSPAMAARMVEPALTDNAVVSFSDESENGIGSTKDSAGGYGFGGGDVIIIRDYSENLDEVERLLEDVDRRPEQVLVEATILSTRLTENNQLGVDFNLIGGVDFNAVNFLDGGQIGSGAVASPAGVNGSNVYGGGTGTNFTDNGGLKLGFVSGDVSVFLSALEGVTDTSVLANPKVLAVNKQKGEVLVGREDGYITTTLTETSATQQVEFLKTGTKLLFRPFISRDGFVRLEIHPEDSAGGVDARGLPSKTTTEVTSNVMVKDGHTIVIGGLFRESSTVGKSQVPVLGNIPMLGRLFGRQADATVREEIIILLTPHIIKDMERYANLSEGELKRAEKLRVGTRKGMMPWGRERMAQSYYEKAVAELAKDKPNRGRARFHLNAALHLNPSFIEAIELKERLTRQVVVEADGSTIRSFLRRAVRDDVANSTEPLDVERPDDDPVVPETRDRLEGEVRPTGRMEVRPSTRRNSNTPKDDPQQDDFISAPATRPADDEEDAALPTTRPQLAGTDASAIDE